VLSMTIGYSMQEVLVQISIGSKHGASDDGQIMHDLGNEEQMAILKQKQETTDSLLLRLLSKSSIN
jgi:hypothetical protein